MTAVAAGQDILADENNELNERGARDCSYSTAGSLANSTGTETAVTAWTADKAWTLKTGHVFALHGQCLVYNAAAGFGTIERLQIRMRKAVNSTAAQILGTHLFLTTGTSSSGASSVRWTSYICNNTGSNLTGVHIGLTVQRVTGSAANHIYGDATFPAMVTVEDLGLIVDNPNLLVIAIAIT